MIFGKTIIDSSFLEVGDLNSFKSGVSLSVFECIEHIICVVVGKFHIFLFLTSKLGLVNSDSALQIEVVGVSIGLNEENLTVGCEGSILEEFLAVALFDEGSEVTVLVEMHSALVDEVLVLGIVSFNHKHWWL